jgi:hypothetical protein
MPKIINTCTLAVVVLVFFPYIIISNIVNLSLFNGNDTISPALADVSNRLASAYYLIFFLAAVVGTVIVVIILLKARSHIAITMVSLLTRTV